MSGEEDGGSVRMGGEGVRRGLLGVGRGLVTLYVRLHLLTSATEACHARKVTDA